MESLKTFAALVKLVVPDVDLVCIVAGVFICIFAEHPEIATHMIATSARLTTAITFFIIRPPTDLYDRPPSLSRWRLSALADTVLVGSGIVSSLWRIGSRSDSPAGPDWHYVGGDGWSWSR